MLYPVSPSKALPLLLSHSGSYHLLPWQLPWPSLVLPFLCHQRFICYISIVPGVVGVVAWCRSLPHFFINWVTILKYNIWGLWVFKILNQVFSLYCFYLFSWNNILFFHLWVGEAIDWLKRLTFYCFSGSGTSGFFFIHHMFNEYLPSTGVYIFLWLIARSQADCGKYLLGMPYRHLRLMSDLESLPFPSRLALLSVFMIWGSGTVIHLVSQASANLERNIEGIRFSLGL